MIKKTTVIGLTLLALSFSAIGATSASAEMKETKIPMAQSKLDFSGSPLNNSSPTAVIREDRSLNDHTVKFKGGYMTYFRYLRGGVNKATRDRYKSRVAQLFDGTKVSGEINLKTIPIGSVYHAAFKLKNGRTCMFFMGWNGRPLNTRGGEAFSGYIEGAVCNDEEPTVWNAKALELVSTVKLRK